MAVVQVDLRLLHELRGHTNDVNCCSWSPSDQTLCSCSGDNTVRVWATESGQEKIAPLTAHRYHVKWCVHSPSGDVLVSASTDTTLRLWSTASWTLLGTLSGHSGGVRHCAFSADGNLLASASADCTVRVWEVGALRCIATLQRHESSVTCCGFAPNGWLLVTGNSDGDMICFDIFSQRPLSKLLANDLGVNALQVAPQEGEGEGVRVATAGNDNLVCLWKLQISGKQVVVRREVELSQHSAPVYSCSFSPCGSLLASGAADKSVIVWSMATFSPLTHLEAHSRYVTHCSFSPDGMLLATASNDRVVKLWKVRRREEGETGREMQTPQPSESTAVPPALSLISQERWSVDGVCAWLEAVGRSQREGREAHTEDIRAAERLERALLGLSLTETAGRQNATGKVGEDFHCPITQEPFRDPVVAADGYTYERSAIMGWLSKGRRSSPVTNLPLPSTLLVPNRLLRIVMTRTQDTSS